MYKVVVKQSQANLSCGQKLFDSKNSFNLVFNSKDFLLQHLIFTVVSWPATASCVFSCDFCDPMIRHLRLGLLVFQKPLNQLVGAVHISVTGDSLSSLKTRLSDFRHLQGVIEDDWSSSSYFSIFKFRSNLFQFHQNGSSYISSQMSQSQTTQGSRKTTKECTYFLTQQLLVGPPPCSQEWCSWALHLSCATEHERKRPIDQLILCK